MSVLNNKYLGEFADDWKNYTPQVSATFYGFLNTNGRTGYRFGLVGDMHFEVEGDKTYAELNCPNFMLGVKIRDNADFAEYYCDVLANSGIRWTSIVDAYKTDYDFSTGLFINKKVPENEYPGILQNMRLNCYELTVEGYQFPTRTGNIGDFHLELEANCPIIKLNTSNQYLGKDGKYYGFNSNADIKNVADDWILNKNGQSAPVVYDYYIYNKWSDGDVVHNKDLLLTFDKMGALCLYENRSVGGDFDSFLKNNGFTFTKGSYAVDSDTLTDITGGTIPASVTSFVHYNKINILVSEWRTNIPIFASEADANGYINLILSGDDDAATEYILANALNPEDALTNAGYSDDTASAGEDVGDTPLEDGYSRNVFNKLIAIDTGGISELTTNLFNTDTAISDAIKEGLKLYGANPMDAIIDLTYYPFDVLDAVGGDYIATNSIFFGSYKMDLKDSVYNVGKARTIIDMGEVLYTPVFNDFRDFEPYSQLYIYLPYVGVNKLDISNYYKKTIHLQYIIDFTSGGCIAVLMADGVICDSFNGQVGIKQCISAVDYSAYSQNVVRAGINTLKSSAGVLETGLSNGADIDIGKTAKSLVAFEENMLASTQTLNSQRISIRGSGGASGNMCMPQYAFTYCIYNKQVKPQNEREIVGYPSNAGGKVKDFKGFLKCSKVSLTTAATVAEKRMLYDLLQNGIYIN